MSFFVILGIALALAMDAFAVSIGIGISLKPATAGQTFRPAASFGLFQFAMPILGWAAGEKIIGYIERYDHWVAFALLIAVGGRMVKESLFSGRGIERLKKDPTKGFSLLGLSLATSLDALAVGLSLAALHVPILFPAVIIGLVAFGMTVLGVKLGPAAGRLIGKRAELTGGLILILIAIKILVEHMRLF